MYYVVYHSVLVVASESFFLLTLMKVNVGFLMKLVLVQSVEVAKLKAMMTNWSTA
jgi:hypothetical protein